MECSWLLLPFLESFFGFLFGEELAQPVQAALPQRPALVDPLLGEPEARRRDAAGAYPPDLLGADNPALLEDLEMLDHGRQRDGEGRGQLTGRDRTAAQPLDHRPSGRVAQRVKDAVDLPLIKHRLEYRPAAADCQAVT